jgi:hypothetical protein
MTSVGKLPDVEHYFCHINDETVNRYDRFNYVDMVDGIICALWSVVWFLTQPILFKQALAALGPDDGDVFSPHSVR